MIQISGSIGSEPFGIEQREVDGVDDVILVNVSDHESGDEVSSVAIEIHSCDSGQERSDLDLQEALDGCNIEGDRGIT